MKSKTLDQQFECDSGNCLNKDGKGKLREMEWVQDWFGFPAPEGKVYATYVCKVCNYPTLKLRDKK